MQTALGTALFAGARYGEAAQRFCTASDLDPTASEPYLFMGKMQIVAPELECPVIFGPVHMRETLSQGAGHGTKEEAHS
jgi:hypothetical protein